MLCWHQQVGFRLCRSNLHNTYNISLDHAANLESSGFIIRTLQTGIFKNLQEHYESFICTDSVLILGLVGKHCIVSLITYVSPSFAWGSRTPNSLGLNAAPHMCGSRGKQTLTFCLFKWRYNFSLFSFYFNTYSPHMCGKQTLKYWLFQGQLFLKI